MSEGTIKPRYYRHPKYFAQQQLNYDDVADRFYPNGCKATGSRASRAIKDGVGIYVCPVCNTTFEVFADVSNFHRLRYHYLPNEFPRIGLENLVCDECREAELTFAVKMGDGHKPVDKKNIKKLIGRGHLFINRSDWPFSGGKAKKING